MCLKESSLKLYLQSSGVAWIFEPKDTNDATSEGQKFPNLASGEILG